MISDVDGDIQRRHSNFATVKSTNTRVICKCHNTDKLLVIKPKGLPKLFLKQVSALCNIFLS